MIKKLLKYRFVCYLIVSCLVTLIDFVSTISLEYIGFNLIIANTVGMVFGTLTQFVILYKYVYKLSLTKSEFLKFESTFLFGWALSTLIIWTSYQVFGLPVYASKIISIIVTFAVLYIIRSRMVRKVVGT